MSAMRGICSRSPPRRRPHGPPLLPRDSSGLGPSPWRQPPELPPCGSSSPSRPSARPSTGSRTRWVNSSESRDTSRHLARWPPHCLHGQRPDLRSRPRRSGGEARSGHRDRCGSPLAVLFTRWRVDRVLRPGQAHEGPCGGRHSRAARQRHCERRAGVGAPTARLSLSSPDRSGESRRKVERLNCWFAPGRMSCSVIPLCSPAAGRCSTAWRRSRRPLKRDGTTLASWRCLRAARPSSSRRAAPARGTSQPATSCSPREIRCGPCRSTRVAWRRRARPSPSWMVSAG